MPSDTFFRLPEEKRKRLLAAAWEEFTTTRLADASINQIIRKAEIPRGSFYQYFTDKDDLFLYLLEEVKEHILTQTKQAILDSAGDLFEVPVRMFEELLARDAFHDAILRQYVGILSVNPGLDLKQFCVPMPLDLIGTVMSRTDLTAFRKADQEYLKLVIDMIILSLAGAIISTLIRPESAEKERELLRQRVEIIRCGCCRETNIQGGTPC